MVMMPVSALAAVAALCAGGSIMMPMPDCEAKDLAESIRLGMTLAEVHQHLSTPAPWCSPPYEGQGVTFYIESDRRDGSRLVVEFGFASGAFRAKSTKARPPDGPFIRFLRGLGLPV